jgi:hypothetical protein
MIEAFSFIKLLKKNKLSQVYISKRKVTGTHLINGTVCYPKPFSDFIHPYEVLGYGNQSSKVKPLAIKESEHRWYLVAQDEKMAA